MIEIPPGRFDLHTHDHYAIPPEFLPYPPADVVRRAAAIGLMGIAITRHNTVKGWQEAQKEADRLKLIIIPGIELASFVFPTRTPHIIALFSDMTDISGRLPVAKAPATVCEWIKDNGGIAIAAHPSSAPGKTSLSYREIRELRLQLTAIEVVNLFGLNKTALELAQELDLGISGGSDAHLLEQVGLAGVAVGGMANSAGDVIGAIRSKQTLPFVSDNIDRKLVGRHSTSPLLNWLFKRR
ncbi:hypothetical protein M1523_02060 [Patescibacteria group bacterium]|nr:hypothetical protein [Patescibacteria group bacterium]MCL5091996.1 hypothetical protein [Patescibacteria group bacterium]